MKDSVEWSEKTTRITKQMFCYGHRIYLPIARFSPDMIGKPRAHCISCMEGRKANVHKSKTKE